MLTIARTTALVAAAALVVGCHQGSAPSPTPDGELAFPGSGTMPSFGVAHGNTPARQPVGFYAGTVCTANGKPAHIESVTLNDPENMKLVDWGTTSRATRSEGIWKGTVLGDERYSYSQGPVEGSCKGKNKVLSEIAVSVERTAADVGLAHGFTVKTTNGTLYVPMGLALCATTCPERTTDKLSRS